MKFTEVLESLHPVALQERAAALVEHFAGELAEWEREHEALEQHHKQMVYVIRRAKEVLQQLEGDCREVSDPPDRCPPRARLTRRGGAPRSGSPGSRRSRSCGSSRSWCASW